MSKDFLCHASALGVQVEVNVPLSTLTSFKIGGPATYFAQVDAVKLLGLTALAIKYNIPFFIIGNGSNILARDEGYDGLVIRLAKDAFLLEGDTVTAPAGASLAALAAFAQQNGLSGLEFAGGIPGTVGGAVYMNAGAYGGQISDTLAESRYVTIGSGDGESALTRDQHSFGYRQSVYMGNPNMIITRAIFRLTPDDSGEIANRMAEFNASRREKQPLEFPSAGSVYKRPEGHFAGRLIEDCGLKGYSIGGACVSPKHAGFIVNTGGATCADVLALMEHIEKTVLDRFGIALHREIRLL